MDDKTAKLIEQLANKLGTTTEYLWGVLIKQARIDATVTLFQYLLVFIFGFVLYKLHRRFSKKIKDERFGIPITMYSKYEEAIQFPMVLSALIFGGAMIVCFCCFGDIINGYFNPEYWALNKILEKIK